jgi:hypothetical protein
MLKTTNLASVLASLAFVTGVSACGSDGVDRSSEGQRQGQGDVEGIGSIGLALDLAPGTTLASASYTVTGPGGFTKIGSINAANSNTLTVTIGGIPAGTGYSVSLSATSTDGKTSCAGAATFSVTAHSTSQVMVHLTCHETARTGSVMLSGSINLCPVIDGISANPTEVTVGSSLALSADAHDSDAAPSALSYNWTATGGTLAQATTKTPTFTCTNPGTASISLRVSDGDTAPGCDDSGTISVICSLPGSGNSTAPMTIAIYGDAPYGTSPTDLVQTNGTPAFIASINADTAVSLVMHVGDIHSGKQFCTEAYDNQIFGFWTAFQDSLIYTPGDNEWSDCHKVAEGGGLYSAATGAIVYQVDAMGNPIDYAKGDPIANLDLVRSIFFATPGATLGMGGKKVVSQKNYFDAAHPTDAKYVENVMWQDAQTLFVTINLPGGSNNDDDNWYGTPSQSAAQAQEIVERTGADLRWLDAAFAQATANGASSVVIMAQADMWDPEKGAAHQALFEPFVANIATHTTSFAKPVLMLNGDSHVYQSHNPLSAADSLAYMHPGYDVPNFHRIVVHGSTLPVEYLRFTVTPGVNAPNGADAFGPFSWTRFIE